MARYAEPMARLIDELKKLPGVGTKTAQRFAFYILRSSDDDASALAEAVRGLKASLRLCSVCNNITDVDPCLYCTSPRATSGLCALSRSRQTSMQWSVAASRVCTTFYMEHFRRCTEWDRINYVHVPWCRGSSAAKWMR